jgi:hypothetical protein
MLRIFLKVLLNFPFAEFYRKFILLVEGLLLAGAVVGQPSHWVGHIGPTLFLK